jgi:hypothetical protein
VKLNILDLKGIGGGNHAISTLEMILVPDKSSPFNIGLIVDISILLMVKKTPRSLCKNFPMQVLIIKYDFLSFEIKILNKPVI